jgi:hypothetical protein
VGNLHAVKIPGLTIQDDGTDRDAWLAERQHYVTATEAAAIAGSSPYTKLIDVWNSKTDPDHDPESLRNRWLDERAALGQEHEAEILAWLSSQPRTGGERAPFKPSPGLVTGSESVHGTLPAAATPDGWKVVRGKLVLAECKTTQQDWESDGVPQHVYDQCQWQIYVTGAITVWLGVWRFEWSGKGTERTATKVGEWFTPISRDQARIDFLVERVEEFRGWYRDGIAPESDVDLTAPEFDWELEQVEEALRFDALLTELGELEDGMATAAKRVDAIKAELKAALKTYDGRRVRLVGTHRTAEVSRFYRAKFDDGWIADEDRRAHTTWVPQERVTFGKPDQAA